MRWFGHACENVGRWGLHSPGLVFLAMVEEMGEIAEELDEQAEDPFPDDGRDDPLAEARRFINDAKRLGLDARWFLEEHFDEPAGRPDDGLDDLDVTGGVTDADAIQEEVDDLAPLLYQLTWALEEVDDVE